MAERISFDEIKSALLKIPTHEGVDKYRDSIFEKYSTLTDKQVSAIQRICATRKDMIDDGTVWERW